MKRSASDPTTDFDLDLNDGEQSSEISRLSRLPPEMFLHVCSHLDTESLRVLSNAHVEARRVLEYPNGVYSLAAKRERLFWSVSTRATTEERAPEPRWKQLVHLSQSPTKSMKLLGDGRCVVYTTKERTIVCKNLDSSIESEANLREGSLINDCLAVNRGNAIYVCGRDGIIESLILKNDDLAYNTAFKTFPGEIKRISNCVDRNYFATSSKRGHVNVFDERRGPSPSQHRDFELKHEVVDVAMNTNYIFLLCKLDNLDSNWTTEYLGEMFQVNICDRRRGRITKTLSSPVCADWKRIFYRPQYWYSWHIDVRHDWICVSGSIGFTIYDPSDDYRTMRCYPFADDDFEIGYRWSRDYLIAQNCRSGTVILYSPTDTPTKSSRLVPVATLNATQSVPLGTKILTCGADQANDTLAIADRDGVTVWRRENNDVVKLFE